jgi:hypothetical protein
MATLNFKFVANDAGLKAGINQAKGQLDDLDGHTSNVGSKISGAFKAMGAALLAAGIINGLKEAAKAAQEDATAQALLAQQLETTTGATDAQVKSAEDFIKKTSLMAGVADDVLRPALANAVRGTGDLEQGQRLVSIALDGAAASGKPMETVLQALIKAQNGQTSSLYKLAPQLKETKGGIDEFAASVQGAAETSANPFDKFKVSMEEAKETIGEALLPSLNKLIEVFTPIINQLAPQLAKVIGALAPLFVALAPVIVKVVQALMPLIPSVVDLVKAILPLITSILPPLSTLLTALVKVIVPVVDILVDFLTPAFKTLGVAIKAIVTFVEDVAEAFPMLATAAGKAWDAMGKGLKTIINGWIQMFEDFVNGAIYGFNLIIRGLNAIGDASPIKFSVGYIPKINIPALAQGGVVMPSPGGSIVQVAEAGQPEAIIPLDKLGSFGAGQQTINVYVNQAVTAQTIIDVIKKYSRSTGTTAMSLLA